MDLAIFNQLLSPAGQAALDDAATYSPTETAFLTNFDKLRKKYSDELAKASVETAVLRSKARTKFTDADRMYFTREALEQATGEVVARHRARRFTPFGAVADLCCGVGGDTFALAAKGLTVHAVDSDPLRLAMARANATALGHADRISFHEADALWIPLPDVRAAFADPGRRAAGRRHLNPECYTPALSALKSRFAAEFPLGVKVAPGVAWSDVAHLGAEVEFISLERELKECVLWFGPMRTTARRATVLPAGLTLSAEEVPTWPVAIAPRRYLFDPDPAVVRAGLAGHVAAQLDVEAIDHSVALFTGPVAIASPYVTTYRVELADRFNVKLLRNHLRKFAVGRITVVKRGSLIDADKLVQKLKLSGSDHRFVVLTRVGDKQTMIIGEREV